MRFLAESKKSFKAFVARLTCGRARNVRDVRTRADDMIVLMCEEEGHSNKAESAEQGRDRKISRIRVIF